MGCVYTLTQFTQEAVGDLVQTDGDCVFDLNYQPEDDDTTMPSYAAPLIACIRHWTWDGVHFVCYRHHRIHRCPDESGCCEHIVGGVTRCPVSGSCTVAGYAIKSVKPTTRHKRPQMLPVDFVYACVTNVLPYEEPARQAAWADCIWAYVTALNLHDPTRQINASPHMLLSLVVQILTNCQTDEPMHTNTGHLVFPVLKYSMLVKNSNISVHHRAANGKTNMAHFNRPCAGTKAQRALHDACNKASTETLSDLFHAYFA